jgi:hypothetical protein
MSSQLVRAVEIDRLPSVKRQSFISSDGKDTGESITCFSSVSKVFGEDYDQYFMSLANQVNEVHHGD